MRGRHDNGVFVIDKDVQLDSSLDEAQRARILEIGGRCPVAKTLSGADIPRCIRKIDYRPMRREDCILFSGGAPGAEAAFGAWPNGTVSRR